MKKILFCVMCFALGPSQFLLAQQTVTLPFNSGPFAIDIDTTAKIAVIANRLSNNATIVKLTDFTFKPVTLDTDANGNSFKDNTGAVLTATNPISVALYSNGTRALVVNFGDGSNPGTVSII